MTPLRPTSAVVDLAALRSNYEAVRARIGPETAILAAVTDAGYATASIDDRPFRSGSLNAIGRPIPLTPAGH